MLKNCILPFLLTWTQWAAAASVVIPNGLENGEGGSASLGPFGLFLSAQPSMRYQQIYPASQFAGLPLEGGLITNILFRQDSDFGGNFAAILPRIQVNLSTTPSSALSPVFADNVGLNDTVVFGPSQYIFQGLFLGWGAKPQPFFTSIPLATPFLYVPSAGNLLLDVRNFQPEDFITPVLPLDAARGLGQVFSYWVDATSGTVDDIGLVTRFEIVPVPEPAPLRLGIIAVFVFLAVRLCQTTRQRTKG